MEVLLIFLLFNHVQWRLATGPIPGPIIRREVRWLGLTLLTGLPILFFCILPGRGGLTATPHWAEFLILAIPLAMLTVSLRLRNFGVRLLRTLPVCVHATTALAFAKVNAETPCADVCVLRWPTDDAGPLLQAYALGPVDRVVVISEGSEILLNADERSAVLTHELTHITNHSLWWLAAPWPLAAAMLLPWSREVPWLALSSLPMLGFMLTICITRHFEFACDRRAARLFGAHATASALAKIGAAHHVPGRGLRGLLFELTSTHPAAVRRYDALGTTTPEQKHAAAAARRRAVISGGLAVFFLLAFWFLGHQDPGKDGLLAAVLLTLSGGTLLTRFVLHRAVRPRKG